MLEDLISKISNLLNPERLFLAWHNHYTKEIEEFEEVDYLPFIQNTLLIDEFAHDPQVLVGVYSIKQMKFVWFSDNWEVAFGIPSAEFREKGMLLLFKYIKLSHRFFLFQAMHIALQFDKKLTLAQKKERLSFHYCGIGVQNPKTSKTEHFLFRQHCIKFDSKGNNSLFLTIVENISHLTKGDTFWGRIEAGKTDRKVAHFFNHQFSYTSGDLFSNREMEILVLLNKGIESEAIGKTLFISKFTVEKHRKNMLQKMGVKNTTAMLHIARSCRMI